MVVILASAEEQLISMKEKSVLFHNDVSPYRS